MGIAIGTEAATLQGAAAKIEERVVAHANLHAAQEITKPIILLDADGVLTNLSSKWYAAYNAEYEDTLQADQVLSWDLHKYTKETCSYKVYDYLLRPGFFRDLEPMEGSQDAIRFLSDYVTPIIVTTVPGVAAADRVANLTELFPQISADNIIMTSRKDLIRGPLLVDDAPKNLQHKRKYLICYDHPYNRDLREFTPLKKSQYVAELGARIRVSNWTELADLIYWLAYRGSLV